jgi:hypothetical protein
MSQIILSERARCSAERELRHKIENPGRATQPGFHFDAVDQ